MCNDIKYRCNTVDFKSEPKLQKIVFAQQIMEPTVFGS